MLNRILLPIDSSEHSKKAIEHVIQLAKKLNSKVIIAHAYEIPGEISLIAGKYGVHNNSITQEIEKNLISHADMIMGKTKMEIEGQGIKVEAMVIKGAAGNAIVEIARTENIDLIVMCGRNLSPIERVLLGSVSDYVIHHAKCPVMLVH